MEQPITFLYGLNFMSVSLSDILTATKNIVTALNNATQTLANINGVQTVASISGAIVVSPNSGRLATISITAGGSSVGYVYDSKSTTVISSPIYAIPTTIGIVHPNIPVTNGIVVIPGTGQVVTVTYS
jgi:ABC-type Fe3+ transport system substrate-binding protein